METVTLTSEEQKEIESLRSTFSNLVTDLGLISYQLLDLTERKQSIEQQMIGIRDREASMYKQLSSKYGTGYVDESGNFVKS